MNLETNVFVANSIYLLFELFVKQTSTFNKRFVKFETLITKLAKSATFITGKK